MPEPSLDARIVASWIDTAQAWTQVVRDRLIPSRTAGTDHAIVSAASGLAPGPMLDIGCGEGFLVRELGLRGVTAHGIDVSAPLIDLARAAGGTFTVMTYDELQRDPAAVPGPWQGIVCNFSLLFHCEAS